MSDKLVIQSRTFDLLKWLLPKAEKFPKAYRFSLTQRLLNSALDLQDALIAAEVSRGASRLHSLVEADTHLARLKIYLRLINEWHWISSGQYEHISRMLSELGRMLGGWMKSASQHKG